MLNSVQIQIPKPCHENWNNMTPDEQGRFCGSCKKVVVDFSKMNDKELLHHISNMAGQHTCGRFSTSQLNTEIKTTNNNKRFSWAYVWNVLLASLLATESYAQGEPQIKKKSEVHLPDVSPRIGTFAAKEQDTIPANKLVHGTILQSKTHEPLSGANVSIKGTSKGTVSNDKGEFTIVVPNNDAVTLEVSYVGYTLETIVVDKSSNVNIKVLMTESLMELQGEFLVALKPTFKQKVKRFFRRTVIAPFKKL